MTSADATPAPASPAPASPAPASPAPASPAPASPAPASPAHASPAPAPGVTRERYSVLRPITTRWADNDVYGHVNNVVYYAFFDTAVNGWLMDATGTDIRQLPAIGLVVETSCRFLAPLSFPEPVEAGLRLEKLGSSSVVYEIALFGAGEAAAAVGRFVHVYVDAQTRRPTPVPGVIRTALAHLG